MQKCREFKHQLIEVSHFKIGVQKLKLWNLEVQFLGSHSESHWKNGKFEHENGLKLWPSLKI